MFNATHSNNCKRFWSYIKNLWHDSSNIATLSVNNKELLTPSDKANALNDHFVSVFTRENSDIPKLPMNQYPILQDIIFLLLVLNVSWRSWILVNLLVQMISLLVFLSYVLPKCLLSYSSSVHFYSIS